MKTFVRNLSLKYKIQSIVWVSMFLLLAGLSCLTAAAILVRRRRSF